MKLIRATSILTLLILASCGGGSGSAPSTPTKNVEVVTSGQSLSYIEELRTLEKSLISRLLEAQDLYVSPETSLSREEKIDLINIFKQDQSNLHLVEIEIGRALEFEKMQKMSGEDIMSRFSDRLDDIIIVRDASLDLIELHQSVMKLDPIVDDLIRHKNIHSLQISDKLSSNSLTVYQSGLFIYVQEFSRNN